MPASDAARRGATARVALRGARAAYLGPALGLAPHRNAVAVIAFAVDEPFELALSRDGRSLSGHAPHRAALIAPGVTHHVRASGRMAFYYADALSDDYAAIARVDLDAVRAELLREPLEAWGIERAWAAFGLPERPPPDPRIDRVLRATDASPEGFGRVAEMAACASLSPSRLRVLMRAATGMPLRRYRIWGRMRCVARRLAAGGSLTEAAHAAGFASSAHLSVAFKAMFGLPPSALAKAGAAFDVD